MDCITLPSLALKCHEKDTSLQSDQLSVTLPAQALLLLQLQNHSIYVMLSKGGCNRHWNTRLVRSCMGKVVFSGIPGQLCTAGSGRD